MANSLASRVGFGLHVLASRILQRRSRCPYCGNANNRLVGSKRWILELRWCTACGLFYRCPTDDPDWSARFYGRDYEEGGCVTELPDAGRLEALLASEFEGTRLDFARYVEWLQLCRADGRVLDFGSSWGYGTWQLRRAGYDAVGYEVDARRAAYGRERLDLEIVAWPRHLDSFPTASFDLVFSAHTLEHLAEPGAVLRNFGRILRPGGWLVLVVPNGTGVEDSAILERKESWVYGRKHPLAYDDAFFHRNLPGVGLRVTCVTTRVATPKLEPRVVDPLDPELLVISRRFNEPQT